MRKLFLLLTLVLLPAAAMQAKTLDARASYLWSSDKNQATAALSVAPTYNTQAGVVVRYVKDMQDYTFGRLKDPIYSVYVPMLFQFELLDVELTPFYYFKHNAENPAYQDAYAYGATAALTMLMENDQVNDIYTRARLGASYARQQGTLFTKNAAPENTDYDQVAYFLQLSHNMFQAYRLEAMGAAFQYPDGITDVTAWRGVLNQQDLASLQTLDITRDLRKYALGGRFVRTWAESGSALYIGYSFTENYTADPDHSFIIGNSFPIVKNVFFDIAYNHIENTSHKNKRDIFYLGLAAAF